MSAETSIGVGERVDDFVIERRIGQGGEATVFLARDTSLERSVALKVFHRENHAEGGPRALKEARLIATLDHPNIVKIYRAGSTNDSAYIAMEYLGGGSLHNRIKSAAAPLGVIESLRTFLVVAQALDAAHKVKVLHRDVNPKNLLLSTEGTIKLADFGLATKTGSSVDRYRRVGTPQFMAPELWQGGRATVQSDVYSLGACLYYFLTGGPPFKETNLEELVARQASSPLPQLPPTIPPDVAGLVLSCMAPSPGDRPNNAGDVARMAARALRGVEGDRRRRADTLLDTQSTGSLQNTGGARAALTMVPILAKAFERLESSLVSARAGNILAHGPVPQLSARIARLAAETLAGRVFVSSHVHLRRDDRRTLLSLLARCVPNQKGDIGPATVVKLLAERASASRPTILTIEAMRPLTPEDQGIVVALIRETTDRPVRILLVCLEADAQSIVSHSGIGPVTMVHIPQISVREGSKIVEVWSRTFSREHIRWTPDALLLASFLISTGEQPLDTLICDSLRWYTATRKPVLTSWCVHAASALGQHEEPNLWPNEDMLEYLRQLWSQADRPRPPQTRGTRRNIEMFKNMGLVAKITIPGVALAFVVSAILFVMIQEIQITLAKQEAAKLAKAIAVQVSADRENLYQ